MNKTDHPKQTRPSTQPLDQVLKSLSLTSINTGKLDDGITYMKAAIILNPSICDQLENIAVNTDQNDKLFQLNLMLGRDVFFLYRNIDEWLLLINGFLKNKKILDALNALDRASSQHSNFFHDQSLGYINILQDYLNSCATKDLFSPDYRAALRIAAENQNLNMMTVALGAYSNHYKSLLAEHEKLVFEVTKNIHEVLFLREYLGLEKRIIKPIIPKESPEDDISRLEIFMKNTDENTRPRILTFLSTLPKESMRKTCKSMSLFFYNEILKYQLRVCSFSIQHLHDKIRLNIPWETLSSKLQSNITNEVIQEFFKSVSRGDLSRVNQDLQSQPTLVYALGDMVDLSKREFIKITAFQYALWARDRRMCYLLLKYLPKEAANLQKSMFEKQRPDITRVHGARFSFKEIIQILKHFITHISKMDPDDAKEYWCNIYGKAQDTLPAWVVYLWMEVGKKVGWIAKDFSQFIRTPDQLEKWWIQDDISLGSPNLETAFAWWRFVHDQPLAAHCFGENIEFLEQGDFQSLQQLSITSDLEMDELSRHLASDEPFPFLHQEFSNSDFPDMNDLRSSPPLTSLRKTNSVLNPNSKENTDHPYHEFDEKEKEFKSPNRFKFFNMKNHERPAKNILIEIYNHMLEKMQSVLLDHRRHKKELINVHNNLCLKLSELIEILLKEDARLLFPDHDISDLNDFFSDEIIINSIISSEYNVILKMISHNNSNINEINKYDERVHNDLNQLQNEAKEMGLSADDLKGFSI